MQPDAKCGGGNEHERKREVQSANADGDTNGDEKGQMIRSDHRMAEA